MAGYSSSFLDAFFGNFYVVMSLTLRYYLQMSAPPPPTLGSPYYVDTLGFAGWSKLSSNRCLCCYRGLLQGHVVCVCGLQSFLAVYRTQSSPLPPFFLVWVEGEGDGVSLNTGVFGFQGEALATIKPDDNAFGEKLTRTSPFLQHPVFNS